MNSNSVFENKIAEITIDRIKEDEENASLQPNDSFLLSYPEFTKYFSSQKTITEHEFLIGAYFTYGWMPTILDIIKANENLSSAICIVNKVKDRQSIDTIELTKLRDTINNSLVGASKLLHFIDPSKYAIWDSRVYKYIVGNTPYSYQISNPDFYVTYLAKCKELTEHQDFKKIHESMNKKIGYDVSAFRAVELIMFKNSK